VGLECMEELPTSLDCLPWGVYPRLYEHGVTLTWIGSKIPCS